MRLDKALSLLKTIVVDHIRRDYSTNANLYDLGIINSPAVRLASEKRKEAMEALNTIQEALKEKEF